MINWIKDKYYWVNNHQTLKKFFNNRKELKILLFGYPKSGNTWTRFLIYNYRNLLLHPDEEQTVSYDRLNALQNNIMDRGTTFLPENGFPFIYRTHKIYKKSYNLFDKRIFIHRNPLDTLISSYYFYKNRKVPFLDDSQNIREKLHDIDFYVLYKINSWINFYNTSIKHADFVINYTEIKQDTEAVFIKLLEFLDWDFDVKLMKKTIDISSFKKIKKMGAKKNQMYGNGPKDGSFNGEFTRSGEESQFYHELQEETIDFVLNKFPDFKKIYPNLID
ncbi:MAG: hypothetical protein HN522_00570 [Flavobacteriales bacterium]|nr:hypothetical protein [Flavobacteriales bacterium]